MILKSFDPWKSPLCTCPPKLSLNPYTGCPHGCLYCYAASYIPRFSQCRPKADLLKRLAREISKVEPGVLLTMANSSDPYPPEEKSLGLTRGCLEILGDWGMRVQVVTKSDLVCRDSDLLADMRATVSVTITTLEDNISRILEPGAPLPERRLKTIEHMRRLKVPVSVRIDPVIPGINESEIEDLAIAACSRGAQHIISSSYKASPESLRKLASLFPTQTLRLRALFKEGGRVGRSMYLPREEREKLMRRVEEAARRRGITFSTCREGTLSKGVVSCDGSHLIGIDFQSCSAPPQNGGAPEPSHESLYIRRIDREDRRSSLKEGCSSYSHE
jgi:DNA repair photolyase